MYSFFFYCGTNGVFINAHRYTQETWGDKNPYEEVAPSNIDILPLWLLEGTDRACDMIESL